MAFLFQVNIGPVQPFIASARRTRDLFVGSMLLSELSKAAARAIADQEGWANLIFPAPSGPDALAADSTLNVANKILARVSGSPAELAELVQKRMQGHLNAIAQKAFVRVKGPVKWEMIHAQIADLIEFSWVAVEFEPPMYELARERVEAVLGARKNTRFFRPVAWGDHEVKSSIDGQLESVIPDKEFPRRKEPEQYVREKARKLYDAYRAGPDERLSGVDLLKRLATFEEMPAVLSTSHLAALPFLERSKTVDRDSQSAKNARMLWERYLDTICTNVGSNAVLEKIPKGYEHPILGASDGGMLFEERLLVDLPDRSSFLQIQEARQAFLQVLDTEVLQEKVRPGPYYALLLADGDSMGDVIKHQAQGDKGIQQHQALSQSLDGFAAGVSTIVERYSGAKVYSGGDDVLALLPLHTALACAYELSQTFNQSLRDFRTSSGAQATLSVGIAIVHHLSLLQDALEVARASEKKAKQHLGKNALAITVSKRSGEEYSAVGGWNELYPWLEYLIVLYYNNLLPVGTAYELREVQQRLQSSGNDPLHNALQEIIQIDVLRILRRKLGVPRRKMSKAQEQEIIERFQQRLFIRNNGTLEVMQRLDLDSFINELLVAQILSDAFKQAGIKPHWEKRQKEDVQV